MISNSSIIEWTKDITVAALTNKDMIINGTTGQNVANFIQAIYDKLYSLNK